MIKIDYSKQIGKKVVISEKLQDSYVNMEDITHITCDKYVITTHLVNGQKVQSTVHLLKHFENELREYGFLRANNKTVVNIKHLSTFQIVDGKKYIRVHNIDIPVTKRKSWLAV